MQGDHLIIVTSSFQNVFHPHGLRSVFEKLRFRDRLVWTVGLTVEMKLRFEISLS